MCARSSCSASITGPTRIRSRSCKQRARGAISVYAQGDDYHDVIKKRLKALARWLVATAPCEVKVFVDTAAVMEKPLAQAAGIGWQGKHTNLVSREFGSWLFLGAIFTTLELPRDEAEIDHCGSCRACLDICPTAAFPAPYKLDARRCISYLTIEHKGPIPHEFRKAIGNRIYGCDDCLAVCPWNKFAQAGRETKLAARDALRAPDLAELARLDDAAFRALFTKSPVKRIGRDRFVRNVLIAIGNSGEARFGGRGRAAAGRCKPAGARRGGMGAVAVAGARCSSPRWRRQTMAAETDAACVAEWAERVAGCGALPLISSRNPAWSARHEHCNEKPAFLHHATATPSFRRRSPTARGIRNRCTAASSSACSRMRSSSAMAARNSCRRGSRSTCFACRTS